MIYVITGHLGSGKTLLAVRLVHDYLKRGSMVASNITLNLDHLMPPASKTTAIKLPYIPNESHLEALGRAYEGKYDESKFGCILLDEAGKWLNARDWNDKERRGLFNWITHARKKGWDVILIVQDYEALDAQIRRSVTEVYVQCWRMDRIKVPYLPVRLPRMHVGSGKYGGPQGMKYKRWTARGDDYFAAYDTRESVSEEYLLDDAGTRIDMRAPASMLSAWHLKGRYLQPPPHWWAYPLFLLKWLAVVLVWTLVVSTSRSGVDTTKQLRHALRRDLRLIFPKLRQPGDETCEPV